jgi:hypothetical protein
MRRQSGQTSDHRSWRTSTSKKIGQVKHGTPQAVRAEPSRRPWTTPHGTSEPARGCPLAARTFCEAVANHDDFACEGVVRVDDVISQILKVCSTL